MENIKYDSVIEYITELFNESDSVTRINARLNSKIILTKMICKINIIKY